jgi:hypothetical protein
MAITYFGEYIWSDPMNLSDGFFDIDRQRFAEAEGMLN